MSEIITPRTLSGFMELLPKDQVIFDKIRNTLESIYTNYGFYPLDTPILEDSKILLAKAGGETEKQIYRFNKGDSDLTMRFDLTVPLAKYVAKNYSDLTFPFKRYQIGKVYRGDIRLIAPGSIVVLIVEHWKERIAHLMATFID